MKEGHVRAVVTAHEDRGDRVVRDVFDTEDLQSEGVRGSSDPQIPMDI